MLIRLLADRDGRHARTDQPVAHDLDRQQGQRVGAAEQPDPLGALFVKPAGYYLPGSCVRPANDEVAAVTRRVPKTSPPRIFAMVSRQGTPLGEPNLRDTQGPAFEVRASLSPGGVRVVVNVPRLLIRCERLARRQSLLLLLLLRSGGSSISLECSPRRV